MTKHDDIAFLETVPLFKSLPPELIERMARGCHRRTYEEGQLVFYQGQKCHAFFAVCRGSVKLHRLAPDGREQVMGRVRSGATFAEAAVLNLKVFPVNATAMEQGTELLEIPGAPFLELFMEDQNLAATMVASLASWLHQLVERVEELQVVSAGARLARYFLKLPTRRDGDAFVIELPISKKDLAHHLCITPETLSRQLRRWADSGLIESRRRQVVLRDTRVLLAIADGEEEAGSA